MHRKNQSIYRVQYCPRFQASTGDLGTYSQQIWGNYYVCACVCVCVCVCVCGVHVHICMLSQVQLFVTPWTIVRQAPLSMGFPRQEYWKGLPFPPPGELPNPGIKPASLMSPALARQILYQLLYQPQISTLQRLAEKIKARTLPISCSALGVNRNQQKEKEKERWISKQEEKND